MDRKLRLFIQSAEMYLSINRGFDKTKLTYVLKMLAILKDTPIPILRTCPIHNDLLLIIQDLTINDIPVFLDSLLEKK